MVHRERQCPLPLLLPVEHGGGRHAETLGSLFLGEPEFHPSLPDVLAERLFASAMSKLSLSARGYHRAIRVARSITDLAGSDAIEAAHAAEAIGYRRILAGG